MTTGKDKICVALDVNSGNQALAHAKALKGHVGMFKIGLELFVSEGPSIVQEFAGFNLPVFLDLKFHDIPNTAEGAVRAATRLGVAMLNIHAAGGSEMIKIASDAANDEADKLGIKPPVLLAVTVLTSLDGGNLKNDLLINASVADTVKHYALVAQENGAGGVVASPKEIELIREACGDDFKIVTPGVRPASGDLGDQKRVTIPVDAVRMGADYLVIGRPILAADDPVNAATIIAKEIDVVYTEDK